MRSASFALDTECCNQSSLKHDWSVLPYILYVYEEITDCWLETANNIFPLC